MKKVFGIFMMLILMVSVYAQQGVHEPGTGIVDPQLKETGQGTGQGLEEDAIQGEGQGTEDDTLLGAGKGTQVNQETKNQGEEQQLTVQQMTQKKEEIKQQIQQKQQEMTKEMESMNSAQKKVYENQNQVRLAVHALLEMKDTLGGIGPQVSEIARDFNNSIQSTIKAEEKIQTRSSFSRFFAGGDKKAAEELDAEVAKNQERVTALKQLKEECECDEEVKTMMQEQVQNMEQEQLRLKELAEKEKKSKGLLGWMWK